VTVAWERPFLEALASTKGNIAKACRLTGISRNTVIARQKTNLGFRSQIERVRHRDTLVDQEALGVPSFFEWRERHCAYQDPITGKYKHAENFWFQFQAMDDINKANRLVMVLPPGSGKTTLFGIEYPTYCTMRDRNFRTTIIRSNADEAGKNLTAISERLSEHAYYEWLIARLLEQGDPPIIDPITAYGGELGFITGRGGKVSEQWSRQALTVSGKTSGEKEPSVQAKGWGSGLAGNRADLIILDDAQDPKKYGESGGRHTEKMMELFQSLILGRVYPHQKLIVLGNRLGPDDFIGALIREYTNNPEWHIVNYPAVVSEERRQPLAPELWTWEGLQSKRREVGEDVWAFHWMQEELSSVGATFTRDQLDANKDFDRSLGERPSKASQVVVGVDPAIRGFCAIVALGVDPSSGTRYLIDLLNERGMRTWDHVAAAVTEMARRHEARTVVVETNNTQGDVYERIRAEVQKLGIRCVAYNTATSTGARAEETEFDISTIGKLADDRLFRLPFGDAETRVKVGNYIEQFCMWRPRPSGKSSWHLIRDQVMATLFAESEARRFVKSAQRPRKERKRDVPDWAENGSGGWAWRRKLVRAEG
jgi:hypothetical protein